MPKFSLYPLRHITSSRSIGGADEVGRGAIAGPMTVAIVIPPKKPPYVSDVYDSKKLSPKKRYKLSRMIHATHNVSVADVSSYEIDEVGITVATQIGLRRALQSIDALDLLLFDGIYAPHIDDHDLICIKKGDQQEYAIACASIVAKVHRDNLMLELSGEYAYYGWQNNKGYGTKEHIQGIQQYGLSTLHRKSFVKKFV